MSVRRLGVIIAVTIMLFTACAHTTAAPQAATPSAASAPSTPIGVGAATVAPATSSRLSASSSGATGSSPSFQLESAAQVQPIAAMPAAALAQARHLLAAWESIKSTTDPTLPRDLFGEPTTVTVNVAHRNADGTLTYYWNAFSAGSTQKCGSYYFPSFEETADAIVVHIADQYGPNASASDMCAADAKAYSVRLPLRAPLGHRVVIDVGLGMLVPVN